MAEADSNDPRVELKDLRKEVTSRLDKLAEALGSLIRVEERLSRQNDALGRIGREVDDHEARIRVIEARQNSDKVRWHLSTWVVALGVTAVASILVGVVVALILYMLGVGK